VSRSVIDRVFEQRLAALVNSGQPEILQGGRKGVEKESLRMTADGRVEPFYPEHRLTRSQDLEPTYHDAGQFYWGTARAFLEDTPLFSSQSVGIVLPRLLVQDIDTLEDWEQAEFMYRATNGKQ